MYLRIYSKFEGKATFSLKMALEKDCKTYVEFPKCLFRGLHQLHHGKVELILFIYSKTS